MKNPSVATLLCLFLACLGSEAGAQSTPLTYRDWSVTCDNVKTCMAYSTSANSEGGLAKRPIGLRDNVQEGWMTIERAAGPGNAALIQLSRPDLASTQIPADAELRLLGPNGRVLPRGVFAATLGSRDVIEIAPVLNRQFLSAARGASHLVLVVGPVKRPVFFVSLSGLVASARAIDAHQGRTNSVGALIDIGRLAEASVPTAPARPTLLAQTFTKRPGVRPPKAIMELRTSQCDDAERFDRGGTNIEAFNLDRGRILWSVPCGAGSYNTWNQFYIQPPRAAIAMALFTGKPVGDGEEAIGVINPTIDPAKGTITGFSKARGLGDCGTAETFAWNGTEFALVDMKEMVPCGGITSDFWPSVVSNNVRLVPAR
jgi:hypothetical protein